MENRYSLDELSRLTSIPKRTIRFYMQTELVPRPFGEKRGAWYSGRHLEELLRVQRLASEGFSLERIRQLKDEEEGRAPGAAAPGTVSVRSHVALARGVELVIDAAAAGLTAEEARELARRSIEAMKAIEASRGTGKKAGKEN